jgi:hypothetical protein
MKLILEPTTDILTINNGRRIRVWKGVTDEGRKVRAFLIGFCVAGPDIVKEGDIIDHSFVVPPEVDAFMNSKIGE